MGAVCCNQQGQDFEEISEVERAGAGTGGRGHAPSPGGDAIMMVVVVGISQWKKQEAQMTMVRLTLSFILELILKKKRRIFVSNIDLCPKVQLLQG